MITPDSIPRIDGDMTLLTAHADKLTRTGAAIADTGATIHQGWQELAAVYHAPEADQLLAATGPVMTISASVGEDVEAAAAALRVYAADTAAIQTRLDALRLQATDLVDAYTAAQDESTTVTLDDRSNELTAAVAAQIAAWEAAQLRCANTIRALTGEPRLTSYTSAMTLVEYRGGIDITSIRPTGPLREIFPIDETPPFSSTGNPPVVYGPWALINVPAPRSSTGIIDGPGSYQPDVGFGPYLDRTTAGTAPDPGTPDDDPVINFEGTGFSKEELAEFARGHVDDNNPVMERRPSITEIQAALDNGKTSPGKGNSVIYDYRNTRVIINRDNPFRSTAYIPKKGR